MSFFVARLRLMLSIILLLLPLVSAKDESLFTSSVTYCAPPETLLIQQFDVAYFAKNASVLFNISAASVEPNVNVSANIQLNVYGMHPFNFTIDLCSIFHGALCPLPMYNFSGTDSIALPSSLGVASRIPGVAYKIPDLEAFAQLTLVETTTGIMKACVQSTLSNGWSTHQTAVEWSTGGLALLALLSAIWQSHSPDALAPYRLLDLLYLYQSIATTSFLNLNYPSVYRAFALNFAWAMGLFTSTSMQQSINDMRHLTGGNMADASGGSAVGLVNRKLSPYNAPAASPAISVRPLALNIQELPKNLAAALSNFTAADYASGQPGYNSELVGGDVATVTQASANVLQAGVPIYVNSSGIATANTFMTVFFSTLILVAITLCILTLGYLALIVISRMDGGKQEHLMEIRDRFPEFARAWGLRLCLIALTPIIIFAFYQWTLKDSWLTTFLSVLLLLLLAGCILYPAFLTLRVVRRDTHYTLFTNMKHLTQYGALYAQYRTPRYYFSLPLIIAIFLKAVFVAFIKVSGEAQVILMVALELCVTAAHLVLRPYKTRGGDVLASYLAIVRFVCTGLMVAFMENLAVAAIPRVAIGIIIAVLFSIAVIVLFVNIIICLPGVNRLVKSSRLSHQDSAADSMLEKAEMSPSSTESQTHLGRPRNPTPERNIHLELHINEPYLDTTSISTTAEPASPASIDTSSTNLGSILPRRWSFQLSHSNPNSRSNCSMSPHSADFSSTPSTPRRSVPPSPLASHGHSRQATIEEYSSSPHAL